MNPLIMQAVRNGGAARPTPTPTPSPTPTAQYFNFRATAAPGGSFPGDGAGEIGVTLSTTWNGSYGFTNPGVSAIDSARAIDRRVWGHCAFNGSSMNFGVAAAAGDYYLRLPMGHVTLDATRTAIIVVDSCSAGLRAAGLAGGILNTSGTAFSGTYYVTNNGQRVYKCTTSGSYATGNPTGTGAGISDGGSAVFAFEGFVLYLRDSGAATGHLKTEVVDIDGSWRAETAWPGSPGDLPITISALTPSPGVTILKHPSSIGYPRSLGLIPR